MTNQRPVRTTREDQLLAYLFEGAPSALSTSCERWISSSRPFRSFVERYREKIRKKVRVARDEESLGDLQAELAVAYQLVQERRFSVEYEVYTAGRQRGPDFSVTFRDHTHLNVEVTRLRDGRPGNAIRLAKLAAAICAKLGQMQPSVVNLLALAMSGEPYATGDVSQAAKLLKARVEAADAGFFQKTGFADGRDFYKYYLRLSGVLLSSPRAEGPDATLALWRNPEARRPLSTELGTILQQARTG